MIEICISSELAREHPEFVAECGQGGLRVEVFTDRVPQPTGEATVAAEWYERQSRRAPLEVTDSTGEPVGNGPWER
jgi:hypothetical protein